jgi:hypothetical protein
MENNELILKDLSCRLPYGVKVHGKYTDLVETIEVDGIAKMIDADGFVGIEVMYDTSSSFICVDIDDVKPYLFPLSSMTEEQRKEYEWIIYRNIELHCERYYDVIDIDEFDCLMDFYHKYHFDYRGLIRLDLAIDATN